MSHHWPQELPDNSLIFTQRLGYRALAIVANEDKGDPNGFLLCNQLLSSNDARAIINSQAMRNEIVCNWRFVGQAFATWERLTNERSYARNVVHYGRHQRLCALSRRAWRTVGAVARLCQGAAVQLR